MYVGNEERPGYGAIYEGTQRCMDLKQFEVEILVLNTGWMRNVKEIDGSK